MSISRGKYRGSERDESASNDDETLEQENIGNRLPVDADNKSSIIERKKALFRKLRESDRIRNENSSIPTKASTLRTHSDTLATGARTTSDESKQQHHRAVAPALANRTPSKTLHRYTVKFEIKAPPKNETVNPAREVRDLLLLILELDPLASAASINDTSMVVKQANDIPSSSERLAKFFRDSCLCEESDDCTRYIVSFSLSSQFNLPRLKKLNRNRLVDHLQSRDQWLNEHRFKNLSTEKIGWMAMKATGISLVAFRNSMMSELNRVYGDDSDDETVNPVVPPFEVVLSRVSESPNDLMGSMTVLSVQCQYIHAARLMYLLDDAKLPKNRFGKFVPFWWKRKKSVPYACMLRHHQTFIENSWTVMVTGLDSTLLASQVTIDQDHGPVTILETMLDGNHEIIGVDEAKSHDDEGNLLYVITVARSDREKAYEFLRHKLLPISTLSAEYNGQQIAIFDKDASRMNEYAAKLMAKFGHHEGSPLRSPRRTNSAATIDSKNSVQFPLLRPANTTAFPPPSISNTNIQTATTLTTVQQLQQPPQRSPLAVHPISAYRNTRVIPKSHGGTRNSSTKSFVPPQRRSTPLLDTIVEAAPHLESDIMVTTVEIEQGDPTFSDPSIICNTTTLDNSLPASTDTTLTDVCRVVQEQASTVAEQKVELKELRPQPTEIESSTTQQEQKLPEMESSSESQIAKVKLAPEELPVCVPQLTSLQEQNAVNLSQCEEATKKSDEALNILLEDYKKSMEKSTDDLIILMKSLFQQLRQAIEEHLDEKFDVSSVINSNMSRASTLTSTTKIVARNSPYPLPFMIEIRNSENDESTVTSTGSALTTDTKIVGERPSPYPLPFMIEICNSETNVSTVTSTG